MDESDSLRHVLEKGLAKELEAIKFYLENLEHFNYKENQKAMNELILDSFDHAKWVTEELLHSRSEETGPIPSQLLQEALQEEKGLQEIYRFEFERTKDLEIEALMKKLIKEEEIHEKLVLSLK